MSENKSVEQTEFDVNKSQASMPRLYEHIDRVDLWIMAQRQYHARDKLAYEKEHELVMQSVDRQRQLNDAQSLKLANAEKVIDNLLYRIEGAEAMFDDATHAGNFAKYFSPLMDAVAEIKTWRSK
jgi:hypothetical protein